MDIMKRLRNVPTLVAIVALVLDILIFTGVVDIPVRAEIETYIQRGLEILVTLGVLNNPVTESKGYLDDK
ncbi:hypothetical protein P4V86_03795 [Brevibacillus laterosporus]|uniref:hypothetical protein n=1 Tax=Brevibacillus laterosporus TaxID=1465 RepID=UPI0003725596|nr:hypothetical protein [Brevibacillus laterosporus]ATO48642.1 hypothetical protein BrL25_05620 [Brevibacillus laterosporus DSM 25]MED2002482.1 hypothetical protein [Brevibacillus laterosporus]